jgi:hypothetical protein
MTWVLFILHGRNNVCQFIVYNAMNGDKLLLLVTLNESVGSKHFLFSCFKSNEVNSDVENLNN